MKGEGCDAVKTSNSEKKNHFLKDFNEISSRILPNLEYPGENFE